MLQEKHVLVLEDDIDDQKMFRDAFAAERIECELQFFEYGETLLDFLGEYGLKQPPSLIIVDLNVPKMSGHEVIEELKSHESWKYIPLIAFTTSNACSDVNSAYQKGVAGYITKPFSFKEWRKAVKAINSYWFENVTLPSHI